MCEKKLGSRDWEQGCYYHTWRVGNKESGGDRRPRCGYHSLSQWLYLQVSVNAVARVDVLDDFEELQKKK